MENRLSFGRDAAAYLRYRPRYPDALFAHLARTAPDRQRALDCATGNGQAAVGLAAHFDSVSAIDPSPEQIAAALPHERVHYVVAAAESLPFGDDTFDLLTAAQGAHWFDLDAFYTEARRVARPGAAIAIWGYSYSVVDAEVDAIVEAALLRAIEPYWAAGNRVIAERYRGIPFPFDELPWPKFYSRHEWDRTGYLRYLQTWSAVKRYRAEHGVDPVAGLERLLEPVWPAAQTRPVSFELVGRLGRVSG